MTPDIHVQWVNPEDGIYYDMPGGSPFRDAVEARHVAEAYHETSGYRTRAVDLSEPKRTIFDSKFNMPGHPHFVKRKNDLADLQADLDQPEGN